MLPDHPTFQFAYHLCVSKETFGNVRQAAMSISINEHLLSAQDDYYNGQFRAAVEKLKYILSNEQVDASLSDHIFKI